MSYTMKEAISVAKQATTDITQWLQNKSETIGILNVEDDPNFQKRDIDLIWKTQNKDFLVEIKGDRWHQTGNFFFETYSNYEKGTPGCFMYTEADLLFYYFVTSQILYSLPMPKTRDWFESKINQFKERPTTTSVGSSFYTTVGRLVPIETVMREVKGVNKERLL